MARLLMKPGKWSRISIYSFDLIGQNVYIPLMLSNSKNRPGRFALRLGRWAFVSLFQLFQYLLNAPAICNQLVDLCLKRLLRCGSGGLGILLGLLRFQ